MHGVTLTFLSVTLIFVPHLVQLNNLNKSKEDTISILYEEGVQAYLEERFPRCVEKLEFALKKYRNHKRNTENCRLKCRHESDVTEPLFPVDIEDLRFHEKNIRNTLCLINCKIKTNGNNDNIDSQIEKLFETRTPYEYLHLCYYKINDKQKAASAAFTFLVSNPDHKVMIKNLQQYSEFADVDMKEIVNFEAPDFVYLYVYGADAYDKKDWDSAISNMEESLISYLQEEDQCRAQCEGPFDSGWYPDFIPAIANHFTHSLRCKRGCKKKLATLNGENHDDLLPSHYDYLQYAYFKKGNLHAACQTVASYLLLLPDNDAMLGNMRYYQSLPKVQDNYFMPREEAIRYAQRDTYEERILQYVNNEFNFRKTAKEAIKQKKIRRQITRNTTNLEDFQRFYTDGLIPLDDCRKLIFIANNFARLNDGYKNKTDKIEEITSPHTKYEKFEGITLSRISFLVYIGLLEAKYLKLILEVTEEMRQKIREEFLIREKNLYFSYTHLVCRSALTASTLNRTDFSHKIHADNCNLKENEMSCKKENPAFYWRDFSAILYLNDNFNGGNFIFTSDSKGVNVQNSISPKCGRMVGFSAGKENLHGVTAITKGKRCALALWFTFDENHQEFDRDISYLMLENNITFHNHYSN